MIAMDGDYLGVKWFMCKINEIAQLGHPVLRQQAKKVELDGIDKVADIIEELQFTLSQSNGVGLAAPQIFQSVAIIIIASKPSPRYPLAPQMQPVLMINPEYEALSEEINKDWEGCLSIPGIRALVPRYVKIRITYMDQQGVQQELLADDFIARVFQHEYDHLNGLVYLDRVEDNRDIISEVEFHKMMD